ncbi:hypothetical protein SLEP1_g3261 [Rubroshorea leprosula]|uniref:Uncharacterized protein n=1 Tax=Rubroshorea leprosula TaxID=152421 RepID=A0AAV5HQJ5_9ROSI|nr:hypothetical protein SLEP1_g3261 [Rubroshorea leprosula]
MVAWIRRPVRPEISSSGTRVTCEILLREESHGTSGSIPGEATSGRSRTTEAKYANAPSPGTAPWGTLAKKAGQLKWYQGHP